MPPGGHLPSLSRLSLESFSLQIIIFCFLNLFFRGRILALKASSDKGSINWKDLNVTILTGGASLGVHEL